MSKITINTTTGEVINKQHSPYKNFLQVNKEELDKLEQLIRLNPNAARVYLFLWKKMDKYNDIACTYKMIQKELDISKTSLTQAISILKKYNYVQTKKIGSGNYYTVNGKIVWSSWGTNFKFCKFVAPIVIADNTQKSKEDK